MNLMLKANALDFEVDKTSRKSISSIGAGETIPVSTWGPSISSIGAAYLLRFGQTAFLADDYKRSSAKTAMGDCPGDVWEMRYFSGSKGAFGLLELMKGVELPKEAIWHLEKSSLQARRQLRPAPELYPDLDIAGIEARARELRECATDSEAISQVLNQPVQVVHQAE